MRSLSLTFCAATAAAAAMSLSACAAQAHPQHPNGPGGSGTVTVTPSRAAPGGEVELWTDACGKAASARGTSEAFSSEARFTEAGKKGLHATARIRPGTAPDTYDIRVTCEGGHGRATGTVTVVHRTHPSPAAPVRAGGGGTAALAARQAATGQDGSTVPYAVAGTALGAVAVGAFALRGARRRRARG
ncbi:hypothetical protein [Streptomyces nitrosporeus]|uniref:hypothetical protein n=1 Tax=Streptomyces nitrosporeus TaxID=28894 RepID=UPI0039A0DBEA